MVWKKSVLYIYIAVVLDRLTPTLSVITVIYALDNASRSNDVKVTTLNSLQCGRRFVDFNTSAVRFTTGVPQQCGSLNLEWTINPTYEPGFLYARKRRNANDFRANGGVFVNA
ncbi:hypothetical protein DPMN_136587 [Dreissena polymorpha]|uniref:Uncharacterized protein n=1 Tax=Dreissena polymorpha TaxID=45954 RepID=A0A9D4JFN8_DREPO|nr:hypothetical protein DPMN_136587 [Dreissena polymorpha]